VTFEFASAHDAKRAARAVSEVASDAALPEEIRALGRDARPTIKGRFVNLYVDRKFMDDVRTLNIMTAWMKKKSERMQP